ncbi:MAG: cobalt ECF transporter T component CbiQ [Promethearchaeota archaeon]
MSLAVSLNREFQSFLAFEQEQARTTFFFFVSPLLKLTSTVFLLIFVNLIFTIPLYWVILAGMIILIQIFLQINTARFIKFLLILGIFYPLVVALPLLFITPGFQIDLFSIGDWTVYVTEEGLVSGGIYFLRIFTNIAIVASFVSSTPFTHIIHALRQLKLPKVFTSLLMLTYRYFFYFFENLVKIIQANECRNVKRLPFKSRFVHLSNLFGNLLLRSIHQGVNIHRAMLARGYKGEFPLLEFTTDRKATIFYIAMVVVFFGLGVIFWMI